MNILVTGASGFLGSYFCKELEKKGRRVVRLNSKNCDLTSSGSLLAFNDCLYDQIYHLAAWTQAGDFCLYHPGEQWIINQKINTHVLEWWAKYQPQAKMITMGTSCAYAPQQTLEEKNYFEGVPVDSLFAYAMTKRMLQAGLVALQKQFGLEFLTLVPSTLYGANYPLGHKQMHFIFDLMRKILRGKKYHEPVVLWGDGYQKREIVHVEDFTRLAMQLSGCVKNEIINIGAGEEYTIRDFAQMICEVTGFEFENIQFDETKYVGAKSKVLDITKVKNYVADFALTPIKKGIKETVQWYEEHGLK